MRKWNRIILLVSLELNKNLMYIMIISDSNFDNTGSKVFRPMHSKDDMCVYMLG